MVKKKLGNGCSRQVAAAGKCECICECAFGNDLGLLLREKEIGFFLGQFLDYL